jgi:hypothetical protein
MKLKRDDKGNVVVQDGKPVYVGDDGKDIVFDAPHAVATITRLNGEAKNHREGKEAAEGKLKAFEGIEDPAAARKALETVANLDAKKLIDAGKVDEIKAAAVKAVEDKYAPIVQRNKTLEDELRTEKIGGAFTRSKFIGEKIAIPADLVQARFGDRFELKDGKITAKDAAGNPIYSKGRPGELADFEEAIETLVEGYPQKDHILKGKNMKGGGAAPSLPAGSKTIRRSDFDALSAAEKPSKIKEGFVVVD